MAMAKGQLRDILALKNGNEDINKDDVIAKFAKNQPRYIDV